MNKTAQLPATIATTSTALADQLVSNAQNTDASIRVFTAEATNRLSMRIVECTLKKDALYKQYGELRRVLQTSMQAGVEASVKSDEDLENMVKAIGKLMPGTTTLDLLLNSVRLMNFDDLVAGRDTSGCLNAKVTLNASLPIKVSSMPNVKIRDVSNHELVVPFSGDESAKSVGLMQDGWEYTFRLSKSEKSKLKELLNLLAEIAVQEAELTELNKRKAELPHMADKLRIGADMAALNAAGDSGRALLASAMVAVDEYLGDGRSPKAVTDGKVVSKH